MLGIVKDFAVAAGEIGNRVGDHGQILFPAHAEHFRHMKGGGLADDRDRGCAGIEERLHAGIVAGGHAAPPRHPKGNDARVGEIEAAGPLEILRILGIGERVAPFDEIDPRFVEPARDRELVFE